MEEPSLEALVFDAYGTLFDVHSVSRRAEAFWPGHGEELSKLWRAKQLEYTWLRSLMKRYVPFSQVTRESLAYACEALGLALDAAREEALLAEYRRLALFADVPGTLARLAGRRLAILPNGSPDMLEPLVSGSGLAFDAVLSVHELGVFKPDPSVYALAAARLGLPPARIGFVSSNGWDALGARAFGFHVFWINRAGAPVDRLGLAPARIIATLGDLA